MLLEVSSVIVAASEKDARLVYRFSTLVVDVTTNGAVPAITVFVYWPLELRVVNLPVLAVVAPMAVLLSDPLVDTKLLDVTGAGVIPPIVTPLIVPPVAVKLGVTTEAPLMVPPLKVPFCAVSVEKLPELGVVAPIDVLSIVLFVIAEYPSAGE